MADSIEAAAALMQAIGIPAQDFTITAVINTGLDGMVSVLVDEDGDIQLFDYGTGDFLAAEPGSGELLEFVRKRLQLPHAE